MTVKDRGLGSEMTKISITIAYGSTFPEKTHKYNLYPPHPLTPHPPKTTMVVHTGPGVGQGAGVWVKGGCGVYKSRRDSIGAHGRALQNVGAHWQGGGGHSSLFSPAK